MALEPLKIDIEVNKANFEKQLQGAEKFARDTKSKIDQNMKMQLEFNIVAFQNKLAQVKKDLKTASWDKKINLQIEANQLQRGLTEAKRNLNNLVNTWSQTTSRLQAKFDNMWKSIWKTFSNIALARWVVILAIWKVSKFFWDIISSGQEVIRIEKQLNTVLENTWKSAQITSEQIYKMATEMSKSTGIDDDAIVALDTILLRYKNISWNVLPAVTQAVIDLAFAQSWWLIPTQEQLADSAQKLWFILNDPIAWYKKLRAIWITFTEDQKEQIKTSVEVWDWFKVQWILLEKIESIYWNASQATDELTKSTALLNISWGNMKENLWKVVIPRLATFVSSLNTVWEAIFNLFNQIKSLWWVWWLIKKTRIGFKTFVTGKPLTMEERASMQPKLITNTAPWFKRLKTKTPEQIAANAEMAKLNSLFEQYWVGWWRWRWTNKSKQALEDYKNAFKSTFDDINKSIKDTKKNIDDLNTKLTDLAKERDKDLASRVATIDEELAKTWDEAVSAEERAKLEAERAEAFVGLTAKETKALNDKITTQETYNKLTDVWKIKKDYEIQKAELEKQLADANIAYQVYLDAKAIADKLYMNKFKKQYFEAKKVVDDLTTSIINAWIAQANFTWIAGTWKIINPITNDSHNIITTTNNTNINTSFFLGS